MTPLPQRFNAQLWATFESTLDYSIAFKKIVTDCFFLFLYLKGVTVTHTDFAPDLDGFESILQYALATCVASNGKSCVIYPPPVRDDETRNLVDGKDFCMKFWLALRGFQRSQDLPWLETPDSEAQSSGIGSALMDLFRVLDAVRKRIYQRSKAGNQRSEPGQGHCFQGQSLPALLEQSSHEQPEEMSLVILSHALQEVWDLLEGRALTAKEIAQGLSGTVTVGAVMKRIKELNRRDQTVKNIRGRGYYRPDASPSERTGHSPESD